MATAGVNGWVAIADPRRWHCSRPASRAVRAGAGVAASRARRWALLLTVVCLATACVPGCRDKATPVGVDDVLPELLEPERDHFALAIETLKQRDEYNLERSALQTLYHLNRWIQDQAADQRWMIDRGLLNSLPLATRKAPATKELLADKPLAQLAFDTGDVMYLEENRWLYSVAQWASAKPKERELPAGLETAGISPKSAKKLAQCFALFDWTVRNIQLEELRPYPPQTVAGPLAGPDAADEFADWPPPMRGVRGPGYDKYPWHILLFGRGDAYQRARVFMLLVRQLRIEAVMLAIDAKGGRAEPWLPAVALDEGLFLFDTRLGLAIPGPEGQGIATLAQVVRDPGLLESLDIEERHTYPVRRTDLDKVVALIDATPESLSQRMRLVESTLSASDQMVLTSNPSQTKRVLQQYPEITDVRVWAVPIETAMYQITHMQLMTESMQARWNEFLENGIFLGLGFLVKGRRQYLNGRIDNDGDQQGAKSYYLLARTPDTQIKGIADSQELQNAAGLQRSSEMSDKEWSMRLEHEARLRQESKEHASYWLGLAHCENGAYDVAANWFKARTLEASPDGPFTAGARYNLARCYEKLGQPAEAARLYLIDESPQRHGNLLRARQLQLKSPPAP